MTTQIVKGIVVKFISSINVLVYQEIIEKEVKFIFEGKFDLFLYLLLIYISGCNSPPFFALKFEF